MVNSTTKYGKKTHKEKYVSIRVEKMELGGMETVLTRIILFVAVIVLFEVFDYVKRPIRNETKKEK